MSTFFVKGTFDTPEITFDAAKGSLEMTGRSLPANVHDFYAPLVKEIFSYFETPQASTVFTFKMDFINSSSSKVIQDFFKGLDELHKAGKEVKVNWFYNFADDDMHELGEDLSLDTDIPIEYIVQ